MQPDGRIRGRETWEIRKPSVAGTAGMVTSQHYVASEVGARVLAEGGNAVDAAVAAGLALGAVEPWMSGLGGCGQMLVHLADSGRCHVVDFGLVSPRGVDPGDYPLVPGTSHDLFNWPAVEDDRNVFGPYSVAVPSYVAGVAAALERFGSWSFARAVAPAVELAAAGMEVDWYATLKIASSAAKLAAFPESARVYLPGGQPPIGEWGGPPPRITLGNLARTLQRLAEAGPADFYGGEAARWLLEDCRGLGIKLDAEDLAAYRPRIREALDVRYRGATVHAAPGLTAGPTLARALALVEAAAMEDGRPGPDAYAAYAGALSRAYAERLETLGDSEGGPEPGCTTHLSVVDAAGNAVALTQTLLSVFGSRVVAPGTGVLLNNGMMWFDPRPRRPNSIAPGKRPLSNMCPVVLALPGGERYALGASGGRRIMPAVLQIVSFLADYAMSLEDAFHQPRIDASGGPVVAVDDRLPAAVVRALASDHPDRTVERWRNGVYPAMYACPNAAGVRAAGGQIGSAYVSSPWALACPAPDASALGCV